MLLTVIIQELYLEGKTEEEELLVKLNAKVE